MTWDVHVCIADVAGQGHKNYPSVAIGLAPSKFSIQIYW